ncbi:MAG: polyribonucleotide nucleotidyltransferase [Rhodobacteraceae bacterium]|nr:polyribonucleotide nucleotidyltransferase [Paracoccaceae bacterium]MCY4248949.1 polyribonucleotide nucleotidyltransferase [Paracoccaceae bacterium]MCY4308643.1 polyribonucleotide nucleotidyltransferase [Paracoccaceae bacterium]
MFNIITKTIEWGGQTLTLETGKIARQADGCVVATLGETCVMAAVTFDQKQNSELDFFPLTVNYQEKYYSSGKIPGGFFKREAKPSEASTLISRLIDRPIRPLFPEGFKNPVDIVCSVLSHDLENDPDILAMVASSAALAISGAPFLGPIGASRVGFANGDYSLNPSISEIEQMGNGQRLDLVVAGTSAAVMMVESIACELTEEEMLGAVVFGHENMQPVIDLINELKNEVDKPQYSFVAPETDELNEKVTSIGQGLIADAYEISQKTERQEAISDAKDKIKSELEEEYSEQEISGQIKKLESGILRNNILEKGRRIDNRSLTEVRPIECEVGLFSRPHGSALFTRGETQALVMTTLGTGDDEQIVDALHGNFRENFLLHYNFPPYSVGETGRLGPPGRREIGHGKLAWRALKPVLPEPDQFPYTIRVVSEITESNGSSSMATVCGASLSMMEAAVPLKGHVAGVAMGLILGEDGKFAVLTDILGGEDHFGDMDFKVAGTKNGVTSLQMDIKVAGITPEIMSQALDQARDARMHILGEMSKAIAGVGEFSEFAPRIISRKIPVDKIREVIGSGGKVIREITEVSGAKIEINDDGIVRIASPDGNALEKASSMIEEIVAVPEVGKIYTGKVVKIMDFGAFVNFMGKRDGLVHISQITNRRLGHPSEVLNEGQEVKVKLTKIDDRGKFQLSMNKAN